MFLYQEILDELIVIISAVGDVHDDQLMVVWRCLVNMLSGVVHPQTVIAPSSGEAEYDGSATSACEGSGIVGLVVDMGQAIMNINLTPIIELE